MRPRSIINSKNSIVATPNYLIPGNNFVLYSSPILRPSTLSLFRYQSNSALQPKPIEEEAETLVSNKGQNAVKQPHTNSAKSVSQPVSAKTESEKEEQTPPPAPKKSLMQRIKEELIHYWHGTRLLAIETRISTKLLYKMMKGDTLTRREYRQVCVFLFYFILFF